MAHTAFTPFSTLAGSFSINSTSSSFVRPAARTSLRRTMSSMEPRLSAPFCQTLMMAKHYSFG